MLTHFHTTSALRNACVGTALSVALNLAPAPADAQDAIVNGRPTNIEREPTRIVRYGDLDLATETGEHAFRKRVRSAVSYVCSEMHFEFRDLSMDRWCIKEAAARVEPAVTHAIALARDGTATQLAAASQQVTVRR